MNDLNRITWTIIIQNTEQSDKWNMYRCALLEPTFARSLSHNDIIDWMIFCGVDVRIKTDVGFVITTLQASTWRRITWTLNGVLHRVDGPAMEYECHEEIWFKHGQCYRNDDLPNYIHHGSCVEWRDEKGHRPYRDVKGCGRIRLDNDHNAYIEYYRKYECMVSLRVTNKPCMLMPNGATFWNVNINDMVHHKFKPILEMLWSKRPNPLPHEVPPWV